MTLPRSLGLLAALALPCASGCVPGMGGGSGAPTPTPAVISTVPVQVGHVRLETARPRKRPATQPPLKVARVQLPSRTPSPEPTPSFVAAKPHDPPKILSIELSSLDLTGGDTVSGVVETTSNVASVEARIAGWSMSVPRTRIGHFEASGVIPDLPIFAKGSYKLEVIARNADGMKAERDVPIRLR